MRSTSWGGRSGRSTSWGGGRLLPDGGNLAAVLVAGGVAAALLGPAAVATAAPAQPAAREVVTGPGAASAVARLGVHPLAARGEVALATLTPGQVRALRAGGLAVGADAPVRLASAPQVVEPTPARPLGARELVVPGSWQGTGSGVTVAVLDSGVDAVPSLAGRVVQGADLTGTGFHDAYGHGTFVAGLIAGDGSDGPQGVAPGARVVSVKVADDQGRSTVGKVAMGLAWVIEHRAQYGIGIANLSLTTEQRGSYDESPLDAMAEATWFSGVTVVVSAGNQGGDAVDTAPANDPFVLTVGSVNAHNSPDPKDHTLSPFSAAGRTPDGYRKPELLEPGEHLRAPLPAGSVLAARQTTTGLPDGYGQLSGTSMSAAVASGEAALLLESNPDLVPDEVKGAVVASSNSNRDETAMLRSDRLAGYREANRRVRPSRALWRLLAALFPHGPSGSSGSSAGDGTAQDDADQGDAGQGDGSRQGAASSAHRDPAQGGGTAATWSAATWSASGLPAATWSAATWSAATWSAATWSAATWSAATWSAAAWSAAAH